MKSWLATLRHKWLATTRHEWFFGLAIVLACIGLLELIAHNTTSEAKTLSAPKIYQITLPEKEIVLKKIENQIIYGYSSEISQTDSSPFTTASGQKVRKGIIANNCYAFGTKVVVRNGGKKQEYEIQDRMNARYGCEVWDIWWPTKQEALNWGVKKLDIIIYKYE